MKILHKARIAGAVMLATAGVAVGTAKADSVLAPLVISDSASFTETYFAFKMRGKGIPDAFSATGSNSLDSAIHYYHIRKMDDLGAPVVSVKGLYDHASDGGCKVTNTSGLGSSWDMIVQRVNQNVGGNTNVLLGDGSLPAGWLRSGGVFDPGPFYGMMVIDDTENLASSDLAGDNGRRSGSEGDLSGFAYVVNAATGIMFDYKLLNNPFSKRSGDFKTNWISKTSIDWMWLPAGNTRMPQVTTEHTAWYTAVTGVGMTDRAENNGGKWDEEVVFTEVDQADTNSVLGLYEKNGVPAPGAYNNDEAVLSGPRPFKVKCLGLYDRTSFLTPQQVVQSQKGGWKRAHIVPTSVSGTDLVKTFGAITYRMDDVNDMFAGAPDVGITFNVETSGHLSNSKNNQHPNRGY